MSQLTDAQSEVLRFRLPPRVWLAAVAPLAAAAIAAVVILATGDADTGSAGPPSALTQKQERHVDGIASLSPAQLAAAFGTAGSIRYDGGPDEGTRGIVAARHSAVRHDGGPEEGTRGVLSSNAPTSAVPSTRYDGGPEEGSRGTRR